MDPHQGKSDFWWSSTETSTAVVSEKLSSTETSTDVVSEKLDPSQHKTALRVGDFVCFASEITQEVGEGYLHGEVRSAHEISISSDAVTL